MEGEGGGSPKPPGPIRITNKYIIDLNARLRILASLGAERSIGGINGLKGYLAFRIPRLNVVVLEKLYETDKGDSINSSEKRANYGDATYIVDIKQFDERLEDARLKKSEIYPSKREAIKLGAKKFDHNRLWAETLVYRIAEKIGGVVIKDNKEIKGIRLPNGKEEEITDYKQFNEIVNGMMNGKYSKKMENRND